MISARLTNVIGEVRRSVARSRISHGVVEAGGVEAESATEAAVITGSPLGGAGQVVAKSMRR